MEQLISVITVCFNSESTIKQTIESVLSQLGDFEYLIIDGGSTDNTIDIIKKYETKFNGKLRWISESDNGWYDAMNKGIHMAKGSFICFLNSDDSFDSGTISTVQEYILNNHISEGEIVYGDSTNVYRDSKGNTLKKLIEAPDKIALSNKALLDGMCGIRHQSMFVGMKVFKSVGELNLKYRLHADWDFLIKCLKANIQMYHINKNFTFYSMYGVSTRPDFNERHLLRKDNRLYRVIDWYYFKDCLGLKTLIKQLIGENRWNDLLFYFHKKRE